MAEIELLLGHYCVGGKSAVGDIRRRYEDRARQGLLQSHLGPLVVGVVADGVGSADFGANAAQIAVDTVFTVLAESQAPTVPEMIDEAIRAANDAVNAQNAREEGDGQTTLVVAVVHQDRVYIGNVGDSRAYWVPASGKLVQITQDHTYYNKYGGDPNSEEAGTVVNAIGLRNKVGVDLGFYMNGEIQDRKRATSLGINGLPLKDGDSIMLCSDGLIKSDPSRQRYVTDEEIVDAIHSEFAPAAVVKMIGYAEGRKVDDNVSVVVIQRLSPQRIEQMASRKAAAKRRAQYRRLALSAAILLLLVGLGASISALLRSQKALSEAQNATPVVIQITNTPMPSPTPTKPIDPGKARVEQVNGEGSASFTAENGQAGVLIPGAYIDTGTVLTSANNGSVRVLVGSLQGVPGTMILLPMSTGRLSFGEKMIVDLTGGAVYTEPGMGGALVNLPDFAEVAARLLDAGGRMVVQKLSDTEAAVLCFKGPCEVRVPNGADWSWVTVKDGEKRVYDHVTGTLRPGEPVAYDEQWQINTACNFCLYDLVPTPTPKPVYSQNGQKTPTKTGDDSGSGGARPTSTVVTATPEPPTATPEPPTEPSPTEPSPTEPSPTEPSPTEPSPTEPSPTEPSPTEPSPTEPSPTEPSPTEPSPTEPSPTEPSPTEPSPTEPSPTEPSPPP